MACGVPQRRDRGAEGLARGRGPRESVSDGGVPGCDPGTLAGRIVGSRGRGNPVESGVGALVSSSRAGRGPSRDYYYFFGLGAPAPPALGPASAVPLECPGPSGPGHVPGASAKAPGTGAPASAGAHYPATSPSRMRETPPDPPTPRLFWALLAESLPFWTHFGHLGP